MALLGLSGTGKSAELEMIFHLSAISGHCTIFVAPDDNSINKCIARLPADLQHKTYKLDMEDVAFPFSLDILGDVDPTDEIQLTKAVNRVMHVFETQWEGVMDQLNLPRFLRMATIALLHNKGCTLPDILPFLTDATFRHKALRAVKDQSTLDFWRRFDEMSPFMRNQQIEPLITRLESLFTGRSIVRNILGQRTSVNLRKVIQDGDILFVSLPVKLMKREAALVGAVFIALLHNAVFSFADTPEDKRPTCTLIIDEWANFCSSDIAELITEGRKFKLKLACAGQFLAQLPDYLQAAFMAMHTKIFFRLTIEDARKVAHLFPKLETVVKPENIDPHPIEYLLAHGSRNPEVEVFINTYLRPLQYHKKGGSVEIKNWISWPELWVNAFLHVPQKDNPKVTDPTQYLNKLLYDAMLAGEGPRRYPSQAVEGFANCGKGFYQAFTWGFKDRLLVLDNIMFKSDMIVQRQDGSTRWIGKLSKGRMQLHHFLYHLIMTTNELVDHPIGKQTKSTVTEVAQELMSLQFRHAYVKSEDESGVIRTDDTFEPVSDEELRARLSGIQTRTRHKFGRSKAEVEKGTKTETKINHSEVI
jgi:glutaredoxin 2